MLGDPGARRELRRSWCPGAGEGTQPLECGAMVCPDASMMKCRHVVARSALLALFGVAAACSVP